MSRFDLDGFLATEEMAYLRPANAPGDPTLESCYRDLIGALTECGYDRKILLHLAFLAWYGLVEPPFITGFGSEEESVVSVETRKTLQTQFEQWIAQLDSSCPQDAEYLYVAWLMSRLFPSVLEDPERWLRKSRDFRARYEASAPQLQPSCFEGQGGYGRYFKKQFDAFEP